MSPKLFKNLHTFVLVLFSLSLMSLSACNQKSKTSKNDDKSVKTLPKDAKAMKSAVVVLKSKSLSKAKGTLKLTETDQGLNLKGSIKGLLANSAHALHFHEKGNCNGKDAKGAGGHFNPENSKHGSLSESEHHAGDLGNYFANSDGVIKVDKTFGHLQLTDGKMAVVNRSMVLHAKKDDFESQPSGAAGKRIACGVVPKIK